jgi:hypothetical protein
MARLARLYRKAYTSANRDPIKLEELYHETSVPEWGENGSR